VRFPFGTVGNPALDRVDLLRESRAPSGGIRMSGSVDVIRFRISLSAGLPGTIATSPLSSAVVAPDS